jgi:hypothetical protein
MLDDLEIDFLQSPVKTVGILFFFQQKIISLFGFFYFLPFDTSLDFFYDL